MSPTDFTVVPCTAHPPVKPIPPAINLTPWPGDPGNLFQKIVASGHKYDGPWPLSLVFIFWLCFVCHGTPSSLASQHWQCDMNLHRVLRHSIPVLDSALCLSRPERLVFAATRSRSG